MNSRVSRLTSVAGSPIRRLLCLSPWLGFSSVDPDARFSRLDLLREAAAQELLIPELGRENADQCHPLAHTGRPTGTAAAGQSGDPLGVPEAALLQGRRREQVLDPVRRSRPEERRDLG